MVNITWELKNAEAVNQYLIEETPTDGVIRKAFLKVTADNGSNSFTMPHIEVLLEEPNVEQFTPIGSVTKEDVLAWALSSIPETRKRPIEIFITNQVEGTTQESYKVFE